MKNLFYLVIFFSGLSLFAQVRKEEIKIENLGPNVNSEYSDYVPIITPDGKTLYFFRYGHPENNMYKETQDCGDIWYSELGPDGQWTKARRLEAPFNQGQLNSIESVSPDGNTMLVHGAYKKGRYVGKGFSITHKQKEGWSDFVKLDVIGLEKMNKGMYYGGFLSGDGKVLFIYMCEEKDGLENDIYISFPLPDGKWSQPVKLGPPINTDKNEISPFLASDNVTLYFSSSRPGGKGDNDIYMSKRLDDTWLHWSEPVNLGEPFNTPGWDAYYTVSAAGDYAYLVTDNNTLGNEDIVRVKLKESIRPRPVVLIYGKVRNAKTKDPVGSNIRYHVLPEGHEVGIARSDPGDGDYKIILPYGKNYSFSAEAPGFIAISENLDLTDVGEYKEIEKDLYLVPVEEGSIVRLNNIFFDFAKSTLRPESYPELDRMVQFLQMYPKMIIEVAGHTDNVGTEEFNKLLSKNRAYRVKEYLQSKGIPDYRIKYNGYGSDKPVDTNDTDEGRQNNRRVEIVILKKE